MDKIKYIDYLKALCMLYVVGFWHLIDYTEGFEYLDNKVTVLLTYTVLGTFSLVSGLLISRSLSKVGTIKEFFLKRFLRIYPLYLIATFLFFISNITDLSTTIKSAALVSMVFGPAPLTLWFITMIMLFYTLAPFLFQLSKKPFVFIPVALILTLLFCSGSLYGTHISEHLIVDVRLSLYFPCFCMGFLVHRYYRARSRTFSDQFCPLIDPIRRL